MLVISNLLIVWFCLNLIIYLFCWCAVQLGLPVRARWRALYALVTSSYARDGSGRPWPRHSTCDKFLHLHADLPERNEQAPVWRATWSTFWQTDNFPPLTDKMPHVHLSLSWLTLIVFYERITHDDDDADDVAHFLVSYQQMQHGGASGASNRKTVAKVEALSPGGFLS